jgi:nucleoside-diphosphate-sugar epimerase
MRLFITGATGFVGSHVLAAALAKGHEVLALRRTPNSRPVVPILAEPIWQNGTLSTITANGLENVDVVLHLASSGVSPKQASWNELVEANIAGTLHLLEQCAKANIRRCVVAGTCHEYGSSADQYEEIPPNAPLEPLSLYGASKAAAFHLARAYAIQHDIELFYGRIFSAYGEGQYEKNFWPSLRRAALKGEDFKMTSGRQISDFIKVNVVANHLLEACRRTDISASSPYVVNIGSGSPSTLLDFAKQQWAMLAATGKLLAGAIEDRPDQIKRYVPDLSGLTFCYDPVKPKAR